MAKAQIKGPSAGLAPTHSTAHNPHTQVGMPGPRLGDHLAGVMGGGRQGAGAGSNLTQACLGTWP